jgi:hypothetical protein
MKRVFVVLLLSFIALASPAYAQDGSYSGKLITEGTHFVRSGEVEDVDVLVVTGGNLTIANNALVTGAIYVNGGRIIINGKVNDDITILDGSLTLGPMAELNGDLNVGGGKLNRSPEAKIRGRVNTGIGVELPSISILRGRSIVDRLIQDLFGTVVLVILAFLTVRIAPHPVSRIAKTISEHPAVTGALGLLAFIVGLSILAFMAYTIILIPVTILGLILMFLAVTMGWIAFGLITGRYLIRLLRWNMRLELTASLGTLVFMIIVNAVSFIPVIGGLLAILLAVIGFGAVLLTRFGIYTYTPPVDTETPDL